MPTQLSCGVVVRRMRGELLLCHATGRNYWDVPKGLRDAGETSGLEKIPPAPALAILDFRFWIFDCRMKAGSDESSFIHQFLSSLCSVFPQSEIQDLS